ncbi:hypothetical protein TWF730_001635 [Orbilia blumenaviensis]|uniref:F-box domain-containing protein n=1 Tax=Orbilia blumenaviensis TaxID=1796055 RepID=A0AAV9UJ74_9PEZI
MTSISSIPPELLLLVAEDLENHDLLSLRRACRDLNAKLRDLHLNAVYHTQRIYLVPGFLENLIAFSTEPSAQNTRAHELRICFQMPYLGSVPDEHVYKSHPGVANLPTAGLNHVTAVERMCDSGQQFEFFNVLFSIFQNVRTISFESAPKRRPSYFDLSLLYPLLGIKAGERPSAAVRGIQMGWRYLYVEGRGVDNWIWADTIESVAAAGLHSITMLGFENNYRVQGINITQFNGISNDILLQLRAGFSSLRRLELYINFNNCRDNPCIGFCQWLENIGHQLEELSLSNTGDAFWMKIHQMLFLPTSIGLPRLKKFEVELMTLDANNLKAFLNLCKGISVLSITGCWFHGSSTGRLSTYRVLKYISEGLPKLRKFDFQILYGYLGWSTTFDGDPPAMLLEVDGDWASEKTCSARLTRTRDNAVADVDDIKAQLHARPDLGDNDQADIFWESILMRDFVEPSWDESLDDASEEACRDSGEEIGRRCMCVSRGHV